MHGHAPLPAPIRHVLLTGFMGAGKTTIGRLLAQQLGWEFLDLDHAVEHEAGCTIAEIFRTAGEPAFRQRETAALSRLLLRRNAVIALGGGALETAATRDLLAAFPSHLLVFLSAPLETLLERCTQQPQAAVRPLLAERDRLHARWTARLPFYRQAHLCIETTTLTPEEAARRIADAITERLDNDQNP